MTQPLTMAGYKEFSVMDALKPGALHLRWMVLVSLFSWARDTNTGKYGWWGSVLTSQRGDFGSLLWKEERSKLTTITLNNIQAHIEQSLEWLVTDRVADSVAVSVAKADSRVSVEISISRLGNTVDVTFADLWEALRGS